MRIIACSKMVRAVSCICMPPSRAGSFPGEIIGKGPQDKPWGMYEFALSDPDQTLVRIGWPAELRQHAHD
jgi:hypothetical protein